MTDFWDIFSWKFYFTLTVFAWNLLSGRRRRNICSNFILLKMSTYRSLVGSVLAKWACDRLTEYVDFGIKIIFSDEAYFDLGGYVNKQNCRTSKWVTVWCGFCPRGIIGPFEKFEKIFSSSFSKHFPKKGYCSDPILATLMVIMHFWMMSVWMLIAYYSWNYL